MMRFDVEGPWSSGDALKLAYLIKAKLARARKDHVLVDLRRVKTPPQAQGKFLICDRLRRALAPNMRIGLIGAAELVDSEAVPVDLSQCPDIALFGAEVEAVQWLNLRWRAEKIPRF
ncbi:hypothetical protein [Ramlibacter tataouinensis]|uniref:hypothetical protein n=1 Tax=Ramlibacter tataouinensis TaxID=94132 RepID=UPI0011AE92A5|nr:hypothetical protein [Ramlibacter tataouinensis]